VEPVRPSYARVSEGLPPTPHDQHPMGLEAVCAHLMGPATRRARTDAAPDLSPPSSAGQDKAEPLRGTTLERHPPDGLEHRRRRGGGWVAAVRVTHPPAEVGEGAAGCRAKAGEGELFQLVFRLFQVFPVTYLRVGES
jgi:hypothetical protein